jgi:phosphoribosylaminoimidazole carboxylase PurE protein
MAGQVIILMGSKGDLEHANKIIAELKAFEIPYTLRIASAHKSVQHLLSILEQASTADVPTVLVAIAGRSNALAGMADANCIWPVITCPPASDAFGGADIYSSLRMPSGVAPLVVLEPANVALAAAKLLALADPTLHARIAAYQARMTAQVVDADSAIRG